MIDFIGVINSLLPYWLLKPRFLAFIHALVKPIRSANNTFYAVSRAAYYDLTFNSQVIYLTTVLNDKFDNAFRRIYIEDGYIQNVPNFLWNLPEARVVYYYNRSESQPFIMYNTAEYISIVDFIVRVPASLVGNQRLVATIDKYKLAGKRFIVRII